MQGVHADYMRIEDYRALETVWREVYQESNQDELLMFHLEYGHLFEKNHNYYVRQQTEADDFVGKHVTHLQRVHNFLVDSLEDMPFREKFLRWTLEHFGPTLASLILLILLWLVLHWIGVDINLDDLKGTTGL